MKRFSFIGDDLSHVAFGAMTIASVLGLTNDMPLVLAITILSAILLLRTGQNAIIKGDAVVAMISVGALAVGYLLMNLFSSSSNFSGDVCSTLFGSTSTPRAARKGWNLNRKAHSLKHKKRPPTAFHYKAADGRTL